LGGTYVKFGEFTSSDDMEAMMRPTMRGFALAAMGGMLLPLGVGSAWAAPVLTLDNATPTVARPGSGFIDYEFTGTVSLEVGFTIGEANLLFPTIGGNPPVLVGAIQNYPYPGSANGGTFVGTLFTIRVTSTSDLGLYDQAVGGGPATFTIHQIDTAGTDQSTSVAYSVNVVAAQVVPEPSTIALAALGGLGLVGMARRRKRA
jgi:hypothetical protein